MNRDGNETEQQKWKMISMKKKGKMEKEMVGVVTATERCVRMKLLLNATLFKRVTINNSQLWYSY